MFTGIVETCVRIISKKSSELCVEKPALWNLEIGQSIAVNGACLSVTRFDNDHMYFDVLSETFRKTNLGESEYVNVERAMSANGRFEGHIVLGHVDETVELVSINNETSGIEYVFFLPQKSQYLVEKGSICINGISLTIGNITDSTFRVYIIPLTQTITNFGKLSVGNTVNIEYDYIAKLMLQNNTL